MIEFIRTHSSFPGRSWNVLQGDPLTAVSCMGAWCLFSQSSCSLIAVADAVMELYLHLLVTTIAQRLESYYCFQGAFFTLLSCI